MNGILSANYLNIVLSEKTVASEVQNATKEFTEAAANMVANIIASAVVVGLAILAIFLVGKFFKKYHQQKDPEMKQKRTWMMVLHSLIRFLIIVSAVLIILSIFGVNISGALTGLGIAGAAAALAVQDLLKDLICGVTIASDKYFGLGDIIEYEGDVAKVVELTMRTTKIQSLKDGSVKSIQNHLIQEVSVRSHAMTILIPLSYELPVSKAQEVLERICRKAEELEPVEKCVYKGANEFAESSIQYLIMLYCDPSDMLNTRRALYRVIQDELEAENIQIPYPQMDVHPKED